MTRIEYLNELLEKAEGNEDLQVRIKTKIFGLEAKEEKKEVKDSPIEKVYNKIAELKIITKAIFDLDLDPEISFDLRGRAAGEYERRAGYNSIRFNEEILNKYEDTFVSRTVPHEWAHLVARETSSYRIKPHGKEWKRVCALLGMEDIKTTHSYDLAGLTVKRQQTFEYTCGCKIYNISKVRHNRISRGTKYRCRDCGNLIMRVYED